MCPILGEKRCPWYFLRTYYLSLLWKWLKETVAACSQRNNRIFVSESSDSLSSIGYEDLYGEQRFCRGVGRDQGALGWLKKIKTPENIASKSGCERFSAEEHVMFRHPLCFGPAHAEFLSWDCLINICMHNKLRLPVIYRVKTKCIQNVD